MSTQETPLYDLGRLIEMSRNNDGFVKKMAQLFINEATSSVEKIKEAYKTNDYKSLKYYSHRLKPSILNLDINGAKKEIGLIEEIAEKGEDSGELGNLIEKLDAIIVLVVARLKSEFGF